MAPLGLLVWGRPPTANKELRPEGRAFLQALRADHAALGAPRFDGLLFGSIAWFTTAYDRHRHPDADNISKKIWDEAGLRGLAYADDKQIRLRTAAILDLAPGPGEARRLDLPPLPSRVADALDRLLTGGDALAAGFAYIEIGPLQPAMLRFVVPDPGDSP